jgi:hypothetical protein
MYALPRDGDRGTQGPYATLCERDNREAAPGSIRRARLPPPRIGGGQVTIPRSRRIAATAALAVAGVLLVSAAVLTVSNVSAVFDGELVRCGAPVDLFGAPDVKPVTVTVIGPTLVSTMTYDSVTGCGRAKHEREKVAAGCIALAVVTSAAAFVVGRRRRPPAASTPPAEHPV